MQPGSMTEAELLRTLEDDYQTATLPNLTRPVILDVGAHVGGFSLLALKRWPDGFVYAFEPHPRSFFNLWERTKAQGAAVRCREVAVVHPKTSPTVRLYEGVNGAHESSTRDDVRWPHCSQRLDVWHDVATFDAADLPPCDVLKVDTEGNELPILRAYRHLSGVRVLLVEPHAVGGDYPGEERRIVDLAMREGFTKAEKGIAWRFTR